MILHLLSKMYSCPIMPMELVRNFTPVRFFVSLSPLMRSTPHKIIPVGLMFNNKYLSLTCQWGVIVYSSPSSSIGRADDAVRETSSRLRLRRWVRDQRSIIEIERRQGYIVTMGNDPHTIRWKGTNSYPFLSSFFLPTHPPIISLASHATPLRHE